MYVAIQTTVRPEALVPTLRATLASLDPELPPSASRKPISAVWRETEYEVTP
jgi:hypothetical protein